MGYQDEILQIRQQRAQRDIERGSEGSSRRRYQRRYKSATKRLPG